MPEEEIFPGWNVSVGEEAGVGEGVWGFEVGGGFGGSKLTEEGSVDGLYEGRNDSEGRIDG
jgi:hypothetical protein